MIANNSVPPTVHIRAKERTRSIKGENGRIKMASMAEYLVKMWKRN